MPDTWTLTIPAPAPILSANDTGGHWARTAPTVAAWRDAACTWARKGRLPKGLQRVEIHLDLWFPVKRNRDRENYNATLKPIIDGLTTPRRRGQPGYGLIPDDTPTYLAASSIELHEGKAPARSAFGLAVVTITDLSSTTPSGRDDR